MSAFAAGFINLGVFFVLRVFVWGMFFGVFACILAMSLPPFAVGTSDYVVGSAYGLEPYPTSPSETAN